MNLFKTSRSTAAVGIVCALLSGIFWGLSGNCGQYLCSDRGMTPQWITVWRMIISGVILLVPYIAVRKKHSFDIFRTPKSAARVVGFGFFGLLLSMYTYMEAIRYTNAATTTVLQYIGPVFVLVYICLREKRLPLPLEAVASVVALAGIFLIATGGDVSALKISGQGLIWGLISALGLVFYTVIPSGNDGSDMVPLLGYGLIIGGVVFGLFTGAWAIPVKLDWGILSGISGVILPGTVLGYGLYLEAIALAGPVRTSIVACIEPFASVFISVLWFKTDFGATDLIATVLMTSAVIMLSIRPKRRITNVQ